MRLRLLALLVAGAAALPAQFTLRQAFGSAFPFEIKAAPAGNRVAWISMQNGPWNVWLAEAPAFEPRCLTRYQLEDGQELSELVWSADGKRLFYTRGGGANRNGENPNPTSDTRGAEQAVWTIEIAGGEPRRLGEGRAPLAAPQGERVVWLKGGTIWTGTLDADAKPAPLFKARGSAASLAFSRDGTKLAFASSRSDHGFIGVYDFATQTVRWVDPSTDRDDLPAWSPDGKRLAFLRVPYERPGQPFGARRTAAPWSLRVADLASGAIREVFRAESGSGSIFQAVFNGPSLIWTASDHLVFPWERTGWKLLYAVPAAGGAARALSPGAYEVEMVEPAADGQSIVVSSNQNDIDRRHLWRLRTDGAASLLSEGTGIEWAPSLMSDGSTIALLRSDARTPARPALWAGGKMKDLCAPPADFPSAALVEPQAVTFSATDGMKIPAQLFLPAGLKAGERRAAVVFFHGGSRRQMLLGWHPMYYYHNAYAFNQYLASRGYIVLSVNYRSGVGYGMEFREALNYGASGASEYQDVAGAGLYLRSRADVDGARIGLWGGSYGGYLTALGLARASDLFAAGVDLHGVHEWVRDMQDTRPGANQMKEDFARTAYDSSPMAWVDGWRSPVLLIHGDDDRNVIFNQTVMLVQELRKRNVDFEQLVFPDEVHDFLLQSNWLRALDAGAAFLDRKLGGGRR